jgi:hypothetical protein
VDKVKVEFDVTPLVQLQKNLEDFAQKPFYDAFRRSLKRALDSGALIAYRLFAEQYRGSVARLKREKMIQSVITNGNGRDVSSISAGLNLSAKRVSISAFSARQNKEGVRWGNGQFVKSGFKAPTGFSTTSDGNIGTESFTFFKRIGAFSHPRKGSYAGRILVRGPNKGKPILRERLKKLMGYSAAVALGEREAARTEVMAQTIQQFDKEFDHNFNFYLQRALDRANKKLGVG